MTERPILMNGKNVRRILEGRKTQTRRVIKPQAEHYCGDVLGQPVIYPFLGHTTGDPIRCPYGQPGDRLWVRETWCDPVPVDPSPIFYRADYPDCVPRKYENVPMVDEIKWRPSIFMPKRGCRLWLKVLRVRVERLQEISGADAVAEGIEHEFAEFELLHDGGYKKVRQAFRESWDAINAKRGHSWESNPWVWVVEFKRIDRERRVA